MKFKIAVVQFHYKLLDPDTNIKRAESFIKKASKKADIIVFPEDFITGPIEFKVKFADSKGKYKKIFQELAKKYSIDIVMGSVIEKERGKFYNTSYYIDHSGKIKGKYQKIHLWHTEKKNIAPGKKVSVFKTKFGKVGLSICWDLIFPEIYREMTKQGVDIIFCPSHWMYSDAGPGLKYNYQAEAVLIDNLSAARAIENEAIFVFCNAAGENKWKNKIFKRVGHSQITVPFQGAIKKVTHNKETMFIQEVDTKILKVAEKAYKIRKDI